MNKKIFNPEKYGMVICPCCNGHGHIQIPEHRCCPKCGGFGFVKKEAKERLTSNPLNTKYISNEDEQA